MKKYKVLFDTQAKSDLLEIFQYLQINDSDEAASALISKVEMTCKNLEKIPARGHIPEELRGTGVKKYLEIHFKPYRIVYEIKKNIIYVHSVLDGRRNIRDILTDRILR